MLSNDIAMGAKRNLHAREEGLNVEDPSEDFDHRDVKKRQSGAYSEPDQEAVCSAFGNVSHPINFIHACTVLILGQFVQYQLQLLRAVIDKRDLVKLTREYDEVGVLLRTLDAGLDSFVYRFVQHVPTCANEVTENRKELDGILNRAVNSYSRASWL